MAKFRRYDPRNKKSTRDNHRTGGRRSHHMEIKNFKIQKHQEDNQIMVDDMSDYLQDRSF